MQPRMCEGEVADSSYAIRAYLQGQGGSFLADN
jgi:hypothetical protein